ncbi:hypothetical protein [Streptomyces sp. NPDC003015]
MNRAVMGQRAGLCVRQAGAVLALVVLVAIASLAVGGFMSVTPLVDDHGCSDSVETTLVYGSSFDTRFCAWREAIEKIPPSDVTRRVEITGGNADVSEVQLSVVVPTGSALAEDVRRGKAAEEVNWFVGAVWGIPVLGGTLPEWRLPAVTVAKGSSKTSIDLTGTFSRRSGQVLIYPSVGPTSLQLSLPGMRLREVETDWHIVSQGSNTLSAEAREAGMLLSVAMAPAKEKADRFAFPGSSGISAWFSSPGSYAPNVIAVLEAIGRAGLAATGWIALLLACRAGSSPLGQVASLSRLRTITGAVLLVHIVVSVTPWLGQLYQSFQYSLLYPNQLLTWRGLGQPPLPGSLVLFVTAILVVVPRSVTGLLRDGATGPSAGPRRGRDVAFGLAAVVPLAAAGAALLGLADLQGPGGPQRMLAAALLPLGLTAVLAVLAAAGVTLARRAGWQIKLSYLLWAAAFVPLIAVVASIHSGGGLLPSLIRWPGPLLAGTVAIMATGAVTWWVVTWSKPSGSALLLAPPVAAILAAPWHREEEPPGWWDLTSLTEQLDAVLGLVLVVAVVRTLRTAGQMPVTSPRQLRGHRALGMVLLFSMAAGSYSLQTIPSPVSVAAAALMVWLIFPYGQIRRAAVVLAQSDAERVGALNRSARTGALRRALPALRKAAQDKVTEGAPAVTSAQRRLRTAEQASYDTSRTLADGAAVSGVQLAFGASMSPTPWQRAARTTTHAAILGAPWTLLALAGAVVSAGFHHHRHPALAVLTTTAPILLTWVGFGLLYGYFFPVLRGKTALAKALWMWGVMIAPVVLQVVASRDPSHWSSWTRTILYALQALTFAIGLGLLTDADVLSANRMRAAHLADIHNLGFITAWWSSVAVALAAGVATLIITGVGPFVLDIFPEAPRAPTPSVSPTP